ncbi:MAG: hypothetical protein JW996_06690, partial [Candidatus Cloacimonetes bacterium]|nr:hypothetical protein [Candidatus Cloacimonadota bacterium]
ADDFDIREFTDPLKYNWESYQDKLAARENLQDREQLLNLYEQKKVKLLPNMAKSVVFPGWGHFSAQHYSKGHILLGIEILLLGASFYYYDIAMTNYDKYKKATYIEDINRYYNAARTPYSYSQVFLAAGVLVWLYTIYDTISVTESYNQSIWEDLFFDYQQKKLIITPTGITMRF